MNKRAINDSEITLNGSERDGIVINSRDITERKEAEEKLRPLFEAMTDLIMVFDREGRYLEIASTNHSLLYKPPVELLGKTLHEVFEKEQADEFLDHIRHTLETRRSVTFEYELEIDDRRVWFEATVSPMLESSVVIVARDVTERKGAEEALRRSEASLAEAQRMAHLGNWEWDLRTGELWCSDEVYRICGFGPQQFVPTLQKLLEIVHPDDRQLLMEKSDSALYENKPYDFEHRIIRPDGMERVVHRRAVVVRDEEGEPLRMVGTVHDITERKALEERLKHRATHDPLTELPNRALLVDRLGQVLARQALARAGRQGGKKPAVLVLDLDDFKVINDSLGHQTGDHLLVSVGRRLRALLRSEDTVAHFGGDEFVIVLEDADADEAGRVAQRLVEHMRTCFAVEGRELTISCSVGVTLGGSGGERPADLLRRADLALYEAKTKGKSRYAAFEEKMEARALERFETEHLLRQTTEREEGFVLHYQPVVSLGEGSTIVGFEVLVRWNHPWRGLLMPAEFLPLAEQTGMIVGIGHWVLREACHQAKEWQERCPSEQPLTMSVNLSARQLTRPGLVEDVAGVLRASRLEPRSLILEVTESAVMADVDASVAVLRRLKDLGVRIAVDDFGKGYSSLYYLKCLPVDILKIDRSFVGGLGTDGKDEGIFRVVIELARALGLEVVAEGVESGEQLECLLEMGCELAQGFYFWRPVPVEGADELLATYNYP